MSTFVTPSATRSTTTLLTVSQVDYLRKELTVTIPELMSMLQHVVSKETVRVGNINDNEVTSSGGDARTQDACNVNALQAKIDLEKVLMEWSVRVARYRMVDVKRADGSVITTKPAGRPAHKQAINVAAHVAEHLDWLSLYDFMGKDAVDMWNEINDAVKGVRIAIGDDAKEPDGEVPEPLPRNAAQVARDSGLDKPMVASEIVRWMNKKGYPNLKVDNINKWAYRGHIEPKGPRIGKRAQYLMSDVMEVAQREGKNIAKRHPDSYLDDAVETLI